MKARSPFLPLLGVFLLVLCCGFFSLHSLEVFSLIGRVALAVSVLGITSLGALVLCIERKLPKYLVGLIFISIFIFLIYAISSFNDFDWQKSLFRGIQVAVTAAVLVAAFMYGKASHAMFDRSLYWTALFSLLVVLVFSLVFDGFGFQNPNSLGMAAYVLLSIFVFTSRNGFWRWTLSVLAIWLIVWSGSRASLLAAIAFFVTYGAAPLLKKNKSIHLLYMFALFGFGFFAILFVTGVVAEDWLLMADGFSRDHFNKRIESGRNEVWTHVMGLIYEKPFLGWGGGVELSDLSEWEFSVHNLYLQVLLQIGLVGLLGTVTFIFIVWYGLYYVASAPAGRVAISSFTGLLTLQFFEVSLFQNNLALSLPIVVLIGLALGRYTECACEKKHY